MRLDPSTGVRFRLDTRADDGDPGRSTGTGFGREGEDAPTRTRCCCTPRWWATRSGSPARTASSSTGASCNRCSTRHRPVETYKPGTGDPGPRLLAATDWHEPWTGVMTAPPGRLHARPQSEDGEEPRPAGRAGPRTPAAATGPRRTEREASAARRTRCPPVSGAEPPISAPTPFPAIESYAFLSDCHTGALIAPDGSVEWLCVPSFDSPERLRLAARPRGGPLPHGPVRHQPPHDPRSTSRVRT